MWKLSGSDYDLGGGSIDYSPTQGRVGTAHIYGPVWAVRNLMAGRYPEMGWNCPYGKPGDHLWVKETFCPSFATDDDSRNGYCYRATNNGPEPLRWKP